MTEIAQAGRSVVDRMQVRIEHLDKLLSLAGEVIITSANLQDLERRAQDSVAKREPIRSESLDLIKTSNEASRRISQDLHDLVMAIRLVRIGDTFRLFRRPVRDLCRSLGRDVDLVFEGEETMIDKALAERLVDPLLHLLRNAVDHGIEAPLERTRSGKPSRGRLILSAADREHTTEITVRDDGRGIDAEEVRRASGRGGPAGAADEAVLDILCRPGFSMAGQVTSTSGRGVGLDLVRELVHEFDGELRLESEPGKGALFRMEIPKLRAVNIIDALTLRAGPRLYALPIERVVASLGVAAAEIRSAFGRDKFFTYQGDVIAIRDLEALLGAEPVGMDGGDVPLVVVQGKKRRLALVISDFLGPQKLVHMPLDDFIRRAPGVAGTAIFTGGRLGLTLDIDELIESVLGSDGDALSRVGRGKRPARTGDGPGETPRSEKKENGSLPPAPDGSGAAVSLGEADAAELVEEVRQNLEALQDAFLNMESDRGNGEHLNEAFRRLHAVKGNFTMLEAEAAAETAHHLETVLDYLRAGRMDLSTERMDLLLDGVGYLNRAREALPGSPPERPKDLWKRLRAETTEESTARSVESAGDLIGRAFDLSPTLELQTLSAMKRGENLLETYFVFRPGRQADFLVAYLLLRRLGLRGNVLAAIPSVDEIEKGNCGAAVKVLWATPMEEAEAASWLGRLAPRFNMTEHGSVPATVFRNAAGLG